MKHLREYDENYAPQNEAKWWKFNKKPDHVSELRDFIVKEMKEGDFTEEEMNTNIWFMSDKIRIAVESKMSGIRRELSNRNMWVDIYDSDIPSLTYKDLNMSYFEWDRLIEDIRRRIGDPRENYSKDLKKKFGDYKKKFK